MVEISERNRESQDQSFLEQFFPSDHITTMKGNLDNGIEQVGRTTANDNHHLKTVDMLEQIQQINRLSDPTLGLQKLQVENKKKSVSSILVEEKVIEGTDSHVKNILINND